MTARTFRFTGVINSVPTQTLSTRQSSKIILITFDTKSVSKIRASDTTMVTETNRNSMFGTCAVVLNEIVAFESSRGLCTLESNVPVILICFSKWGTGQRILGSVSLSWKISCMTCKILISCPIACLSCCSIIQNTLSNIGINTKEMYNSIMCWRVAIKFHTFNIFC